MNAGGNGPRFDETTHVGQEEENIEHVLATQVQRPNLHVIVYHRTFNFNDFLHVILSSTGCNANSQQLISTDFP